MKPVALTTLDVAFPAASVMERVLPPWESIPAEFKDFNSDNKWLKFQSDWFFKGLKSYEVTAKDGIDVNVALSHLQAIQGSFEPKHQHKVAAVAYLASLWFDDVKYECAK